MSLKKKIPLKRFKINHMEYYAYMYLALCRMSVKTDIAWAGGKPEYKWWEGRRARRKTSIAVSK
jgi:hypothetical protein